MWIRMAWRNLRQGGRRTMLLAVALTAVTGLLVLLMALSNGVEQSMVRAATALAAGHVNVAGFYKATPEEGFPMITETTRVKAVAREAVPGLVDVVDRHRGWARVVSASSSIWAALYGVEVAQEQRLIETLRPAPLSAYVEGGGDERPGDIRRLAEPGTAMLFAAQAKRLGVQVGDGLTLRTETLRGQSNTVDLTVVAVMDDLGLMSNWSLFLPKETLLQLYGLDPDTTGAVMLYLDDIERAPEVMETLRGAYAKAGFEVMEHDPRPFFAKFETVAGQDWTGERLDLTTWTDEVSFLVWVITAIDSVSFLLIAVLTGIIAIGIMNALWIAVRERTTEIGTLRAIGMSRARVLAMFMTEALLLGLIGCFAGAAGGALVALGVDALSVPIPSAAVQAILMNDRLHLVIEPGQLMGVVIGFTVICGLSALWPAARAARMPPITAIHVHE
ncbi:MAG: ABC transporter permease [Myxococcales bacterium]|nr:ABC transporter permease [Myxococcales bacterium]MCB9550866.1 ABC transporter permease [Myxococcales bacterium]